MVDRVATFAQSNSISSTLQRLQATYAAGEAQESSGLKSENYQGIAATSQKLLNMESDYSRISTYSETAQVALNQVNSMYSATQSMTDIATNFLTSLSAALGGTGDTTSLQTEAQSDWDEFVSLLNTQQGGKYLFGGSVTDEAPVDTSDSDYTAATATSSADTSYYQGNDTINSVQASDTLTVSYGVTADNPAFEKVMRAFNMVINNPGDQATIQAAYTLMSDGNDDIASIQAGLSSNASTLDTQISKNADDMNSLDTLISDMKNVDVSAVLVRLTTLQTQIESSYSLASDILKLNLAVYL